MEDCASAAGVCTTFGLRHMVWGKRKREVEELQGWPRPFLEHFVSHARPNKHCDAKESEWIAGYNVLMESLVLDINRFETERKIYGRLRSHHPRWDLKLCALLEFKVRDPSDFPYYARPADDEDITNRRILGEAVLNGRMEGDAVGIPSLDCRICLTDAEWAVIEKSLLFFKLSKRKNFDFGLRIIFKEQPLADTVVDRSINGLMAISRFWLRGIVDFPTGLSTPNRLFEHDLS